MAGRGMLFADGPSACPFVALESDRDRRAAEPDPRHRCYAEPMPAPRALVHQREFCLSPDFGGCPIFQDWAVRAAARPVPLRPPGGTAQESRREPAAPEQLPAFGALTADAARVADAAQSAQPIPPPSAPAAATPPADAGRSPAAPPIERLPSLPPDLPDAAPPDAAPRDAAPRDAAPRAAAPDARRTHAPPPDRSTPADVPAAAAPADTPARPRARPRWTDDWPPSAPSAAGSGAAAVGAAGAGASVAGAPPPAADPAPRESDAMPHGRPRPEPGPEAPAPPFLAARRSQIEVGRPLPPPRSKPERRTSPRDEWSAQRADLIPPWERERYAAYPGLRTRIGLGDRDALLSRLTRILGIIAIGAVVIALLLLAPGFFAGAPVASPTATAVPSPTGATASPSPTVTAEPTVSFETYVVRAGDSLSAIAVEFGLLPCQIQVANPEVTDPNHIFIGQVLRIPPDDFGLDECAPSSPAAS